MIEEIKHVELVVYGFPFWAIFLMTLGTLFVGFESGFLVGRHRYRRVNTEKDALVGPMVGAMLGLLAFMLTFSFGVAASHFNTRRHLVLDEANAIRSCYHMAQMLSADSCAKSRKLMRDYVDFRLQNVELFEKLDDMIGQSNNIHNQLWSIAMADDVKQAGTPSAWLYIQSLSDMINMQASRLNYGRYPKISPFIWIVLYGLAILSMAAMGYHAGLVGIRGFFVYPVLILAFTIVMVLIIDLDRPRQTLFKVSQQSLIDLQQRMTEPVETITKIE